MTVQPGQKKGGALKWVLIGCGGILFLGVVAVGVGVWLVARNFTTDPAKVESMAREIATFETPEGLRGQFGMSMMGVKMAVFATDPNMSEGKGLVLMSAPAGQVNRDQMARQMREKMAEKGSDRKVVESKGVEKFRVRGKETEATVEVTADKEGGRRGLQYTMAFEGNAGATVLLMLMGDEKELDRARVQKFLDTVK